MFTNYYGQTKEQYDACKELIEISNHRAVLLVTVLSILINGILVVISFFNSQLVEFRQCYVIVLVIILFYAASLRISTYMKRNVTLQLYLLIGIELLYGGLLSLTNLEQKGTAFPVFLVLIPMLFIDRYVRMSIYLFVMSMIYSAVVLKYKFELEAYYDVFECIAFGGVSVLAHYFFNVKMMRGLVNEMKMQGAIAAYQEAQKELRQRAERDHMTGLYNRETFIDFAQKHIKDMEAVNGMQIVCILDVDHFKDINDSFGHQTGDDIIRQVSDVLRKTLRKADLIGRLGGDEYIFILNDIHDKEIVRRIVERIISGLNGVRFAGGISIRASVGITMTNERRFGFEELYNRADIALYKAKELGRNQYCFYEDHMIEDESQVDL